MPRSRPRNDPPTPARRADADLVDLRQVEQVMAVCRAGGITDAARLLGVSQPALSKSISRLEKQLGVKLFERDGRGARPTRYGRLVAARGPGMLGAVAELRQEISLMASGASGRLRIGSGPASRIRPLQALAPLIVETYPLLKLEMRSEGGGELMRAMAEGRYDLVFAYYESAAPFGDLIRVKVLEDRRIAVVRPGHPALASGRPLTPREFLSYPIASAGTTPAFRDWTGPLTADESRNATAIVSDDYDILAACAAASDTIAWGPQFVFEAPLRSGALVEAPITWPARYACWMLTTAANWRLPIVKAIADLARSVGQPDRADPTVADTEDA